MAIEDAGLSGWHEQVSRLRQALDKDEFVLYGQPIHALRTSGAEPMAEILVRLQEEEKALQPPGEFLPVLEHYKMMPELDNWVLRRLITYLARASQAQRFSINVSRQTLERAQLPKIFADRIKLTGVRAASVIFEIDEADLMERAEAVAAFAAQIKAAGGGIMVDGFGRKAVSFTPLAALHPDYVKVDGTIVRQILKSPALATKLDAILRFCLAKQIGVVAECVEEDEVLARLKLLGVGYAQGFGIARPRPIGELLLRDPGVGLLKAANPGRADRP
jgi:EAL domain-containing protein (putative c-di-GMP-specific phosphodiesterase class I)